MTDSGASSALPSGVALRDGTEADLSAVIRIYDHYILNTVATLYTTPRTPAGMQAWFATFERGSGREFVVAECAGNVIGFAASTYFNPREGYARSVMSSIYLAPDQTGRGIGPPLYRALLERIDAAGCHRTFAWITQPNEPSVSLHLRCGFRSIGTMTEAGHKFGAWRDVMMMERAHPAGR